MRKHAEHLIESMNVVLVGEAILRETEEWVVACEHCAHNAMTALEYLLDAVTGNDTDATEYIMCRAVRCPSCSGEIREKTLVAV